MKGGKAGRPRRTSKSGGKPGAAGGNKPGKSRGTARQPSTAPKKGARRKEYGGHSSNENEI